MSTNAYPYPPDEFDTRDAAASPDGIHRARASRWSRWWPFLAIAVVCAATAIVAVTLLTGDPGTPAADGASPPATADASPTDAASPTDGATDAASPDASPDLATLVAAADSTAYIRVLNDGGPAGEAGKGVDALVAQGFTDAESADFPGDSGATGTVIWYADGFEDTAKAVAAVLGVPEADVAGHTLRSGDVIVVVQSALNIAAQ